MYALGWSSLQLGDPRTGGQMQMGVAGALVAFYVQNACARK